MVSSNNIYYHVLDCSRAYLCNQFKGVGVVSCDNCSHFVPEGYVKATPNKTPAVRGGVEGARGWY